LAIPFPAISGGGPYKARNPVLSAWSSRVQECQLVNVACERKTVRNMVII
jgi:hypothetical protein